MILALLFAAVPRPTPDQTRRALHEVALRGEFTDKAPDWRLRIRPFFDWLGGLHDTAPVLFWILLVGCIGLLVLLVAHIIWTVRRVLFAGERDDPAAERRETQRRMWREYRDAAAQHAGRGEFTEAVRALFLALVYRLDETGRVLFQRALTNREYLGLFAEQPRVRDELTAFVDVLDDDWYGQRPTGQDQYARCLRLYEGLERSL